MAKKILKTRFLSFLLIFFLYLTALAAAIFTYVRLIEFHPLLSTFIANIAGTLVVWLFGIIFKNSSLYDPYWSVAPIIIIIFWVMRSNTLTHASLLFLAAFIIWGSRLTFNWAIRWKGIGHQDWRYTFFKKKSPKMWFLTNLFGINLMPTVIVFLALIPAYYATLLENPLNNLAIAGFLICLGSVATQLISDRQLDIFKKSSPEKHIDKGLWKYCRHPNYLGEISFWWGIWLMQLGMIPTLWVTIIGPLMMTLLFIFISIPLMEMHILETKPDYSQYKKQVHMILPGLRKKIARVSTTNN